MQTREVFGVQSAHRNSTLSPMRNHGHSAPGEVGPPLPEESVSKKRVAHAGETSPETRETVPEKEDHQSHYVYLLPRLICVVHRNTLSLSVTQLPRLATKHPVRRNLPMDVL